MVIMEESKYREICKYLKDLISSGIVVNLDFLFNNRDNILIADIEINTIISIYSQLFIKSIKFKRKDFTDKLIENVSGRLTSEDSLFHIAISIGYSPYNLAKNYLINEYNLDIEKFLNNVDRVPELLVR